MKVSIGYQIAPTTSCGHGTWNFMSHENFMRDFPDMLCLVHALLNEHDWSGDEDHKSWKAQFFVKYEMNLPTVTLEMIKSSDMVRVPVISIEPTNPPTLKEVQAYILRNVMGVPDNETSVDPEIIPPAQYLM